MTTPSLVLIVPDALAIAVCAVAVSSDLRHLRIPNRLTGPALAGGLALNAALGGMTGGLAGTVYWLLLAIAGVALGLVVFGVPAAFGFIGMGDVKLAMALGAIVRWPLALPLAMYAVITGGVIALAYAVRRRRLRAVVRNMISLSAPHGELHRIPYALALGLGSLLAVVSRHAP